MNRRYQVVMSATKVEEYTGTTFVGGYGGAHAIRPIVKVIKLTAKHSTELEQKLDDEARAFAKGFGPQFVVSINSVILLN